MKKSFSLTLALTLVLLTLLCFLLTGCGSKEAGPSPEPTQSAQSGENIDSKKIEPTEEPTAEPEPTPEETYYGFELDGEARYIEVSMGSYFLSSSYVYYDMYSGLCVVDAALVSRLQETFESSRFRKLTEEESGDFSDFIHRETHFSFVLYDDEGMWLGYLSVAGVYLCNENNENYGCRLADDEFLSRWLTVYYIDENGEEQSADFEIVDCDDFHQLLSDIADAALAGHSCEEYYELWRSGADTGVIRWKDLGITTKDEIHDMHIFEYGKE